MNPKLNKVKKVKISEISIINKENYSKDENWEYFNYLDTKNITKGKIDEIKYLNPEKDKLPSRMKRKVENKDIIISTVRPNQEHYGLIENQVENFLVSTGFTTLTANKNIVSPEFLYYYLTQKHIIKDLQTIAEQSTTSYPSIKPSDIGDIIIKLPDLTTQNKTYQILHQISSKIKTLNRINQNLEQQLHYYFISNFVSVENFSDEDLKETDWGKVPKSWDIIRLEDIISITSGDRPEEKVENESKEFNIPIYGASKIMGYANEYSYDEPILIIGRVGTHGVVQRVFNKCFPTDNTFVIKTKYYGYIYHVLKRIDYDSLNVGSTQPLITQKSIKKYEINIPPENEINKFEALCKIYFKQIETNNKQIKKLEKIRDTLLPKLMNGEIDVSKIKITE